MSSQPRLFTAKRHVDTTAAPSESRTRRREQQRSAQRNANEQQTPAPTRDAVEDAYGDLS